MDHRAVRLALGLTIAGASLLAAGVVIWLVTDVGRVTSGLAARDLRLAAPALLAGGRPAGWRWGSCSRSRAAPGAAARGPGGPGRRGRARGRGPRIHRARPVPARTLVPDEPAPARAAPAGSLAAGPRTAGRGARGTGRRGEDRGEEAGGEPPSGDQEPAARVWWRAPNSPAGSGDDTSEEWLRSLRGPAIQQPPPHSAE